MVAPHALSAQQVVKQYPSGAGMLTVLDEVDLEVARGDFVAVRGPSGSGKTTLLNLFASLDTPTRGTVTVLDQRVDNLSERRRTRFRAEHIGLVFQDSNLIPGLSALENAMLGRLPWERRRPLEQRSRQLLERIGLGDRLEHPPSHLSGGERQRVGIARALVGNPEILLADEPTGNLDGDSTAALVRLLGELRHELGITVVIATHDEQVAAAADTVVRIERGRVRRDAA